MTSLKLFLFGAIMPRLSHIVVVILIIGATSRCTWALWDPAAMNQRAHWAYNYYWGNGEGSISSAWQSLSQALANQIWLFKQCMVRFNAARQAINHLDILTDQGWSNAVDEYNLLAQQFNELANAIGWTEDRIYSRMQVEHTQEVNIINEIAKTDVEGANRRYLNFINNGGLAFATQASINEASERARRNIEIAQKNKELDRKYKSTQQKLNYLREQLKQNPDDESLWQQYINLLNSQDAVDSFKPEGRKEMLANAEDGLATARKSNRIHRLYSNFKQQSEQLEARLSQNQDDESAWVEYINLLRGQDAIESVEAEGRKAMLANAEKGLTAAKESNRINRQFNDFKQQQATVKERYKSEPIQAREDYLRLLQEGEISQSLDEEYRQAEIRQTQVQVETLKDREQKIASYTAKAEALNQKLAEDHDTEAWLDGIESLILSDDATAFSKDWRQETITMVQQTKEHNSFEKKDAEFQALYEEAERGELSLKVAEEHQQWLNEIKSSGSTVIS